MEAVYKELFSGKVGGWVGRVFVKTRMFEAPEGSRNVGHY